MSETFNLAFGIVAAIAGGIALLTVFFMVVARINQMLDRPGIITLNGIIDEHALVDVVLKKGERISDVKLVGFTDTKTGKAPNIPYQMNHLAVFKKDDGRKYFIRPESISYMEEK
jgi:hypothetical protein